MNDVTRLSGLVAILMFLQPLLGALQGYLLGCERYRFIAGLRAVQSLLRPVLVLVLVAGSGTLASAIVALVVADVGCVLASWARSRRGAGPPIGLAATAREAVQLIRAGVPFATIGVGVGLLVDAERLAVAFLRSARELAYYSIAANGILRLSLLPGVMAGLLIPRVTKLVAAGQRSEAAVFGNRATRLGLGSVLLLAIPLASVLPELLTLWLGRDVALAVHRVALVLLVGLACSVASYSSHATLKALGCTGLLNAILWLELPLYGLLVVGVVERLGYVGAAFCLLFRLAVEAAVYVVLAERRLPGLNRGLGSVTLSVALFAGFCLLLDRLGGAGLGARITIGAALSVTSAALLVARDEVRNLAAAARAALR
jgi:O-antigen/teichoic acid export membrane protein